MDTRISPPPPQVLSPDLVNLRSAVGLELRHKDPHNVQQEQEVYLWQIQYKC